MTGFLLYDNPLSVQRLLSQLQLDSGGSYHPSLQEENEDHPVIIQWGKPVFNQNGTTKIIINPAEGIKNCHNPHLLKQILKCNGLPMPMDEKGKRRKNVTIRRYFVIVFQQQVVMIYRSRGKRAWIHPEATTSHDDRFIEIHTGTASKEVQKVIRYAKRMIYVLGLDFGAVLMGIRTSGKVVVDRVTPTPRLSEKLAKHLAEHFKSYLELIKEGNPPASSVILGADPEFVLRYAPTGQMILASKFFKKTGRVGCDSIWLRRDRSRTRLPLAEVRPQPHADPHHLFMNVYKAMMTGISKINSPQIEWLAGGMPLRGYPIGGHIHFSSIPLTNQLLRVLDNYLALPYLLIESKNSLQRRPRYGYLGDVRSQFHGGFEYRSLSSWLVSPQLTKGVIYLSKLLAINYLSLTYFPLYDYQIQLAFYEGDKNKLKPVVKQLIDEVRKLPQYPEYECHLEPYWRLILTATDWDEHQDIRALWKLPPYHRSEG